MWWRGGSALSGLEPGFRLSSVRAPEQLLPSILSILGVLAVVAGATGCAPRAPVQVQGNPQARVEGINRKLAASVGGAHGVPEYLVGPEDLLEVSLYDLQDEEGQPRNIAARVSQNGLISLPLVGHVEVAGHSALQIEELLRDRYRKYIHEPQLTVFVREYRSYRVSVVGYVEKPGLYEIAGEKTLLEALGLAGGLNKEAGTTIQVTRRTAKGLRTHYIDLNRLVRDGDMRFNIPLRPGDVVYIPKAGMFYVIGSVANPGPYPVHGPLTVTQAIATAGGPDEKLASLGGTALYRPGPNGERRKIPIDLSAIASGEQQDPVVLPDDVIVVPMSRLKYVAQTVASRIGFGIPLR